MAVAHYYIIVSCMRTADEYYLLYTAVFPVLYLSVRSILRARKRRFSIHFGGRIDTFL